MQQFMNSILLLARIDSSNQNTRVLAVVGERSHKPQKINKQLRR